VQFTESKGIYVCPAFLEFVWQKHGFGSRQANPQASVTLRQVHSSQVWNADRLADREQEGDALVTAEPGCAIGVRTADCVPILLLDGRRRAVGAIHAGWRGTAASIAARTVEKLQADYASDPADLHAAIGPCIRACCYEVSPEVADRFTAWPESVQRPKNAKPHLDLVRANTVQLVAAGLDLARIYDSNLCTACNLDRFFSFRRQPENPGRMLSVICRI
jgi:polyphenol oxidase